MCLYSLIHFYFVIVNSFAYYYICSHEIYNIHIESLGSNWNIVKQNLIAFLPFWYLPPNRRKEREVEKEKRKTVLFHVLDGTLEDLEPREIALLKMISDSSQAIWFQLFCYCFMSFVVFFDWIHVLYQNMLIN